MKARKGAKKALIAIAHKILIAVYHMLTTGESYRELGSDYLVKLKTSRTVSNMIRQLKILGYQVAAVPQERTAVSPPGS